MRWLLFGLGVLSGAGCVPVVQQHNKDLEIVKSIATPGRSVRSVKADLEERGFEVSTPYDPTKLGKILWMNVHSGNPPDVVDGLLYSAGLPDKSPPSSIIVKANAGGTVIGVVGQRE